jgi:hypothetical protein
MGSQVPKKGTFDEIGIFEAGACQAQALFEAGMRLSQSLPEKSEVLPEFGSEGDFSGMTPLRESNRLIYTLKK